MCGFCGVLNLNGAPVDAAPLERMNQAIHHRGPDDGHLVVDGPAALANRRLAILDLRPEARLPMSREPLHLAYNGEFYTFVEARERLQAAGHSFTTTGDTEVILALYREHGEAFVDHLSGMYAFALWDGAERTLCLGRDPAGKKPLFYYLGPDILVFGSELKSVLLHPAVPRRARLDSLALLLSYGYVPTPDTCFEGIRQLPPGQLLTVRDGVVNEAAREFGIRLSATAGPGDPDDWVEPILDTLREAVRRRLVSDVPLGAFLSGGIDSALVVALMAELMDRPPKTFSIGFEGDSSWDESDQAEETAKLFGADHTAFRVGAPAVQELLPRLVWHHDQPFGDSSAIPVLLLCELARREVTVALTGDAGDELFAGYERFLAADMATRGWPGTSLGRAAAAAGAALLARCPKGTGYADRTRRAWRYLDGIRQPMPRAYFRWVRLATDELLDQLLAVDAQRDPAAAFEAQFTPGDPRDWVTRILDVNYRTYLLDDLLVKSDRMSMAASLELRSPFLDPAMVALASRIPTGAKIHGGTPKAVLRSAARRLLPAEVSRRPKHGFGVPLGEWFRGRLGGYVREVLLDPGALAAGWFRPEGLRRLLDDHASGRMDHAHVIWTLLTIEHWRQLYLASSELRLP